MFLLSNGRLEMNPRCIIGALMCLHVLYLCRFVNGNETKERKRLVLLSFDGFRWDYIDKFDTPNFDALAKNGVHARLGMRPVFSTKTFPNHYTIVTGLYEESHGIVNNRMYDPLFDASFKPGNNETRWWDGGQPIWITARLQNKTSAVYFWPGSETKLSGIFANYYYAYNKSVPFKDRLDQVIDWLVDDNVDFAAAYVNEPDGEGHMFGAFSTQVGEKVRELDQLLGYFLGRMDEKGLTSSTNIIVLSDHGMTNVTKDEEHVIVLSDYLDMENEVKKIPQTGSVAMIIPKEGMKETIYQKLLASKRKISVFKKEDIPERMHYKNHRRIHDIVVIADDGYYIVQERPINFDRIGPGEHGYDNDLISMKPIFYAKGPDFKKDYIIPNTFDNVNIYSLMCHLMGIKPAPNNGSWTEVREVLVSNGSTINFFSYIVFVSFFIGRFISFS